jgi:hypothetical protein
VNAPLHQKNMQTVAGLLRPSQGYAERPDAVYGTVFQCAFVPCCIPLPVLVWVNPQSEGVFVRIIFPPAGDGHRQPQFLEILNRINYDLPTGGFAADLEKGEIRFKNTLFFGNTELDPALFVELMQSSFEMVRTHFPAMARAMTGQEHAHTHRP